MKSLDLSKPLENSHFAKRGRPGIIMIDVFPVADGERLILTFESADSDGRHGVWLQADQHLLINGIKCSSASLWADTSPPSVPVECHTSQGLLRLYNIWEREGVRGSQSHTSGMLIEELPRGRRYRCADSGLDPRFDSLVFRLERA